MTTSRCDKPNRSAWGGEGGYQDVSLAAAAETLAYRMRRKKPAWVHDPSRSRSRALN
jgi:hypothetical protein